MLEEISDLAYLLLERLLDGRRHLVRYLQILLQVLDLDVLEFEVPRHLLFVTIQRAAIVVKLARAAAVGAHERIAESSSLDAAYVVQRLINIKIVATILVAAR